MSSAQSSIAAPFAFSLRRERCAEISIGILITMILVGLAPLSAKVKTIASTGDGDLGRQLVYGFAFGFLLLTSGALQHPRRLLVIPLSLTLLLGYCCLSLSWSIEPAIAARRLTLTILIIWTIFKAVELAEYERIVTVLRVLVTATLVLNYAAVAFSPVGRHMAAVAGDPGVIGDWRGVLPQKNFAGAVCAFTIMMFLLDARDIRWIVRAPILLAATYFLYRTHSKTSVGLMAMCLVIGWAYPKYNPRYRAFLVPIGVALVGTGALVAGFLGDRLLAPFTGQEALTGRGSIWPPLLAFAQDHWLMGAGYGSFWNIGPGSPIKHYAKGWVAEIASGHNGYIDLLTQIGFPGMVAAVAIVIVWPLLQLFTSVTVNRSQGSLLIAFLVFCAGHNVTESSLLDRDMIVEAFLMLTVALIGTVTRANPQPVHQAQPAARYEGSFPQTAAKV